MQEGEHLSLKEHFNTLRAADQIAIQAALAAQEKAILKAENAAERRFELLNELRQGVATKEQLEALEKVVRSLEKRVDLGDGRNGGLHSGWLILLGLIGLISTLLGIYGAIK